MNGEEFTNILTTNDKHNWNIDSINNKSSKFFFYSKEILLPRIYLLDNKIKDISFANTKIPSFHIQKFIDVIEAPYDLSTPDIFHRK